MVEQIQARSWLTQPTKPRIETWIGVLDDTSSDPAMRAEATRNLRRQGVEASTALPALIRTFHVPELREDAVAAVSVLGESSVEVLRQATYSGDYDIRMGAAMALGRFGAKAQHAIADLEYMLGDSKYVVRREALRAIRAIDPERMTGYVPLLLRVIQSEPVFYRRWEAVALLGEVGPAGQIALPILAEMQQQWTDHHSGFDRLILKVRVKLDSSLESSRD